MSNQSPVGRAVQHDSEHQVEADRTFGISQPRGSHDHCAGLATSEESFFTTVLACHLWSRMKHHLPFHQFFDIASRRTENVLGSDLSIGQYDSIFRIRLMHKVVDNTWCDEGWRLSFAYDEDGYQGGTGDYGHLKTLLETYQRHPNIEPYLVVNVIYCVHDYRRIGKELPGIPFAIPGLDSLLRTVVVDLRGITKIARWSEMLSNKGFRLTLTKESIDWKGSKFPPSASVYRRIAQRDKISVILRHGVPGIKEKEVHLENCVRTLKEFEKAVASVYADNESLLRLCSKASIPLHEFARKHKRDVLARNWTALKS